jgi:hypothetical protein
VPVVLPEAGLLAAFAIVPFMAACVMVGLQFSLGSKGTLGSTVKTVAVVGILGGVVGLCAYQSIASIAFIGPILGGMSPASFIFGSTYPDDAMAATTGGAGLASGRVLFGIGAVVGTALYALICYGLHSNMVRTFDMTVRKLAGTG